MPRWIGRKSIKKSNQPGPSHKCRRAKYYNTSGRPNRHTPGWVLNDKGDLVHVGVDAEGNDNPLPKSPREDEATEALTAEKPPE